MSRVVNGVTVSKRPNRVLGEIEDLIVVGRKSPYFSGGMESR